MLPPRYTGPLPYLTEEQMIEVDRAMIEDFQIELIQMMENAGRGLAHLARDRFLDGDARGKHVVALAGTGGNGGGALVAARRLQNYGARVTVVTAKEDCAFTSVPAHQLQIVRQMDIRVGAADEVEGVPTSDLVLDGLVGYSLSGRPRGAVADLIEWANTQTADVLALDVPSGLDVTTGEAFDPAVRAAATLTLALPKEGLRAATAEAYVGELYLADVSVPPSLYRRPPLSLDVGPVFAEHDVVRLR